jgi:Holliday junction resolvase
LPSPQKAKGSNWERDVAVYLSNLYGESFIRAPGSGAYIGGSNTHRKEYLDEGQIRTFKGDIVPGKSFARLNIECKS